MSNWTQPGQGFKGLDEQVEAISEQQVLSYFDKLLEQDEEELLEILGKIKGKIKNYNDKRLFKRRKDKLIKKHDDKINHHVSRSDDHDDHAAQHDKGDPKKIGKGHSGAHGKASDWHDKAQQAHALAKKAAEKGDHKAYRTHKDAAKKHSERAKRVTGKVNKQSGSTIGN